MLRIFLLLASVTLVSSLARPHQDFVGYESVYEYRARHNISYGYEPKHITHEHCRYVSEEICRRDDEARGLAKSNRHLNPSVGEFKVLVILVRFTNHRNLVLPSRQYFHEMFNGRGRSETNKVGSIRDYFKYNSLGAYDVEFDVRDWRDTDNTDSFYAKGVYGRVGNIEIQQMYAPVLDQLDREGMNWWEYDVSGEKEPGIGDGQLDHLIVIHSGLGAEIGDVGCIPQAAKDRIWSQGSGSSGNGGWESRDAIKIGGATIASAWRTPACDPKRADMGVIVHEFLHGFKLLDMYDGDQNAPRLNIGGLGSFDIMSNTYGWTRSWHTPGHLSPFSKMRCNWLRPIEITKDGYYAVQPAEISSQIYKLSEPYPDGEYLLIENRQPMKFDEDWQGSGIVIYHIDEKAPNQQNRGYPGFPGWPREHYRASVLQADRRFDIEAGVNGGDAGDFWVKGMELSPGGDYPNTDSYQSGSFRSTGVRISILTDSRFVMLFRVEGLGGKRAPAISFSAELGPSGSKDDGRGVSWPLKWVVGLLSGVAVATGIAAVLL